MAVRGSIRKRDVIELVEACYRPADTGGDDRQPWAASLCDIFAPLLDDGLGVVTRLDRLDPPENLDLHVATPSAEFRSAVESINRATSQDAARMYLPNQGLYRLSDVMGPLDDETFTGEAEAAKQASKRHGVKDWIHMSATDGTGYLVVVAAPLLGDDMPGGSRLMWQMMCAHLSAAFRLQRRQGDLLSGLDDSAIVDARAGRVVHAEGRAKESASLERIRAGIRAVDRARVDETDPETALSVWQGLVDGTWSVVDRHDHDGRRYVVAVPNDPKIEDPRGLSEREAQVAALASLGQHDKLIAYTLGLQRSTVTTHIRSAMRKLGIRDRVELAAVLKPTAGEH